MATRTALPRWTARAVTGPAGRATRASDADRVCAAPVATGPRQRAAAPVNALRAHRATLRATGAFSETAGSLEARVISLAARASAALPYGAALAVPAVFTRGAARRAAHLGRGTAAAREAGLIRLAAIRATGFAVATADPGVTPLRAEAAGIAAGEALRAARLVVQAPLVFRAAG